MSNPKDLVGAKKAPMDLVPPAGAIMSAPAHANGAGKYGPFNWRGNPVQAMTYVAAVKRHLDAWIDGQDTAEDTGIHHFSHILAGMNILADAMALGNLIDNRPPKGPAADMLRAQDRSAPTPLMDRIEAARAGVVQHGPGHCQPVTEARASQECTLCKGSHETWRHLEAVRKAVIANVPEGTVENRGDWPPDTRVDGRLTCCGGTEHALDCPQYR